MITITKNKDGSLRSVHIPFEVLDSKTTATELAKLDFKEKDKWLEKVEFLENGHEQRKAEKLKDKL